MLSNKKSNICKLHTLLILLQRLSQPCATQQHPQHPGSILGCAIFYFILFLHKKLTSGTYRFLAHGPILRKSRMGWPAWPGKDFGLDIIRYLSLYKFVSALLRLSPTILPIQPPQTYYLLYFTTSLQKIPPPITPSLRPFPPYLFPLYTITH